MQSLTDHTRGTKARTGAATVIIPTFNEGGNVEEMVRRLASSLRGRQVDVLFVDDSTDDTAEVIADVASRSAIRVSLLHRTGEDRIGGLSGAVCAGILQADSDTVVVMDGDLQHPPESVPNLLDTMSKVQCDLVVASRYCGTGAADGLSSNWRQAVSTSSTVFARWLFPLRVGRKCTDPMTGFFCLDRRKIDLDQLRPRGFKILFEIMARHDLIVAETPFVFGERNAGDSKASWRQGTQFISQALSLRLRPGRGAKSPIPTQTDRTGAERVIAGRSISPIGDWDNMRPVASREG